MGASSIQSRSVAKVGSRTLLCGALVLLGVVAACSRSARKPQPVASLPSTPKAAAAFGALREAWETRRQDRAALEAFVAAYPRDGAIPQVKVYLAFAWMAEGRLAEADAVLASIADLPPGTTHDLATVARARSSRLHDAPQAALDSLRPLVGKIVDDVDREMFLEELALSTIGAHIDYEALAYLDAWLRGVGEEDKERVRLKIAQILETLPRPVLEQTYRTMRAAGASSGYGADTQKLVGERLAHVAVETNDAALARWLVEVSGVSPAQTGGDAGLELGELAASRRGLATVSGRTVGLLLPTGDRELRDEAADVVRGVSWSLDLPRSSARETGVRLVTRDDGVDAVGTRSAMEELSGEGAAIILAGFDRAGADRAVAWSEQSGVPVLLLAAPSPAKLPKTTAVVLGERTERQIAMLADALVRHGVRTAAFVADTPDDEAAASAIEGRQGLTLLPSVQCDVPLAEAGRTRFPIQAWWRAGARGWLVSGLSGCGRDVLRELGTGLFTRSTGGPAPAAALTLEAGVPMNEAPRGILVLSASAGLVPVLATRPEEASEEDIRAFMTHFGVRPSYWTALGHDAGALAKAALGPLPNDTTTDPKAVLQRRAIVQAGLLATRVKLWTSDEQTIGSDRVLGRTLRLVTWERDKK
jgi:hypothetical protein